MRKSIRANYMKTITYYNLSQSVSAATILKIITLVFSLVECFPERAAAISFARSSSENEQNA